MKSKVTQAHACKNENISDSTQPGYVHPISFMSAVNRYWVELKDPGVIASKPSKKNIFHLFLHPMLQRI